MNRVQVEALATMARAMVLLQLAEDASERDELREALQLAEQARTHERMAEYAATAAMLGKDVRPRE